MRPTDMTVEQHDFVLILGLGNRALSLRNLLAGSVRVDRRDLTACDSVEFVADLSRAGRPVDEVQDSGLSYRADHFPVAVARAPVKDSPILVGDEPTGSLDAPTGSKVLAARTDPPQPAGGPDRHPGAHPARRHQRAQPQPGGSGDGL
ncbi:MAG: hypothetical protein AB1758_37270 [Candidatus Eremiobacterota bacterium]